MDNHGWKSVDKEPPPPEVQFLGAYINNPYDEFLCVRTVLDGKNVWHDASYGFKCMKPKYWRKKEKE